MDITKLNNAIEQDNQAKLKEEQEKLAKRQKEQQDVKEFIKKLGIDEDIIQEKEKEYINSIKNCSDDILQEVLEEYLVNNPDLRGEEKLTLRFINWSFYNKKVSIWQEYDYERGYKDFGNECGIEDLSDYIDWCEDDNSAPMHLSIKTEFYLYFYLKANNKKISGCETYTNKSKYKFDYFVIRGYIYDEIDKNKYTIISKALKEIIKKGFYGLDYEKEIDETYEDEEDTTIDNINLVIDTLKERLEDFGFKIIDIKSDAEDKDIILVTVKNPLLEQ